MLYYSRLVKIYSEYQNPSYKWQIVTILSRFLTRRKLTPEYYFLIHELISLLATRAALFDINPKKQISGKEKEDEDNIIMERSLTGLNGLVLGGAENISLILNPSNIGSSSPSASSSSSSNVYSDNIIFLLLRLLSYSYWRIPYLSCLVLSNITLLVSPKEKQSIVTKGKLFTIFSAIFQCLFDDKILDSGVEHATTSDLTLSTTFIPLVYYYENHLKNIVVDILTSIVCVLQENPYRNQALQELKKTNLANYLMMLLLDSLMLEENHRAKNLKHIIIHNSLTFSLFRDDSIAFLESFNAKKKYYSKEIVDLQYDILNVLQYCIGGPMNISSWAIKVGVVPCLVKFLENCAINIIKKQEELGVKKKIGLKLILVVVFLCVLIVYLY
jgi:hypothetical protein